MVDEKLFIIEDADGPNTSNALAPWLLVIIDDDKSVHEATRFALDDFVFEARPLEIVSAYSAKQAREYMADENSMAVILLDVVMETEAVGLELVKWNPCPSSLQSQM